MLKPEFAFGGAGHIIQLWHFILKAKVQENKMEKIKTEMITLLKPIYTEIYSGDCMFLSFPGFQISEF